MLYARASRWLDTPRPGARFALLAFLCSLPSLALGLQADDYILRQQVVERGPLAAYVFQARDPRVAYDEFIQGRAVGSIPWWADEHAWVRYFRPLSSLSLWLDFTQGAPAWWMHLENCGVYAAIVWLAVALYQQLGLSGPGLAWAGLFFALDGPVATSVGWISARNTLLAAAFGLGCLLAYTRARRIGSAPLYVLAWLCFALALLSAELSFCTLGYLFAHALLLDRASLEQRLLALSPFAAMIAAYLVFYVSHGYGVHVANTDRDVIHAPLSAAGALLGDIPIWLASTASVPFASFVLLSPDMLLPLLGLSLAILALLVPLLAKRWPELPAARTLAAGAVLSLVPLAATLPQERLRFFVAFGVYGLLGPWVARDFQAAERTRRIAARSIWAVHALCLPLLFIPSLFSCASFFSGGAANALDRVVPHAAEPITIVFNAPTPVVPWYQATMRAAEGGAAPPVYTLYVGTQTLQLERVADRSLELYAARSWAASPYERIRDFERWPFRSGDRIALQHLTVDVREVDSQGVPTRARFTFDRSLDDPGLAFHCWSGQELKPWTPPPVGARLQLAATSMF